MAISNAAAQVVPFAEDQVGAIERLLSGASPEQLRWLSGYVAGYQAARFGLTQPALPAAPPGARTPLTILYATESGNAEAVASVAKKIAGRLGFAARVLDMADAAPKEVAKPGNLMVIASTWGEGDPPQRAEAFHAALMAEDAPRFEGVRFAVLALGDRAYANFCETGRRFDERLAALGATRAAARIDCDLDYEAPAKAWLDTSLGAFESEAGRAAVIHVDFARPEQAGATFSRTRPFAAEIAGKMNLNSSRSAVETWHVELSLEGAGIAYEPGDSLAVVPSNDPELVDEVLRVSGLAEDAGLRDELTDALDVTTLTSGQIAAYAKLTGDAEAGSLTTDAGRQAAFLQGRRVIDLLTLAPARLAAEQLRGLLRPLPPRYYSVASSRALVGDAAHLLVSAVRWHSHGRTRKGVASIDIAERRVAGGRLRVFLKPNPHFRLPADDRPIVMVGPGTGVAPFRAFMQQREAVGAKGRAWLFFGARNFTHDFLYQLEWQDWLKSCVLTRMDVAFSRDQREKIYVQTRMWEARRELYAWLGDGAALYVCGDAAMAKDVHAMLLRVVADQAGRDRDEAAGFVREMQQSGRYLRDVY